MVDTYSASAKAVWETASGQEPLAQMLYYLTHLSRQMIRRLFDCWFHDKYSIFPLLTERSMLYYTSVTERRYMSKPSDLVQGTLDLLILKILALEALHGWAISQRLKQISGDVLQVSDGSLYPALHKLEQEGWIQSEWKPSENNRRAKYYSVTRLGRQELKKETANWRRLSAAISLIVELKGV